MGRRPAAARFMPGAYVFPGGQVGHVDKNGAGAKPRQRRADHSIRLILARTALRETYEETGLLLGHPCAHDRHTQGVSPIESVYVARGLRPAIDAFTYIGRAITPRESPIRFNTRFFVVDGRLAYGELTSNGELDELAWRTAEECESLPMPRVTRFMLDRAIEYRAGKKSSPVLYYYVEGIPRIRREVI